MDADLSLSYIPYQLNETCFNRNIQHYIYVLFHKYIWLCRSLFWGKTLFSSYSSVRLAVCQQICLCYSFYMLNGNSSKLLKLVYLHMTISISLWRLDWTNVLFYYFLKRSKFLGRNLFLWKKIIIRNFWNVTSENQELFIEMPVPSEVSEWSYICLVGVSTFGCFYYFQIWLSNFSYSMVIFWLSFYTTFLS